MKNKYLILTFVIFLILIILVGIFIYNDSNKKTYLKEINYIDYAEKIHNNENFILYVKQTNCNHCLSFTPVFSKVLEKYEIEAFSINLTDMDNEEKSIFLNELSIDSTPTVLFFENGIELGSYSRIVGNKSDDYIIKELKDKGYIKK